MERMDEQILPAVYNAIGASFHATPSQLGILTLARALVQALASPLGGILGASRHSWRFHLQQTRRGCFLTVYQHTRCCCVASVGQCDGLTLTSND